MNQTEIESLLESLPDRVAKLESSRKPIDEHPNDARWDCERCCQLLALVDVTTGRMRFQVREFNVDFKPEPGQPVKTRCKRCGWGNERVVE